MAKPPPKDRLSEAELEEWRHETAQVIPYRAEHLPSEYEFQPRRQTVPLQRQYEYRAGQSTPHSAAYPLEVGHHRNIDRATIARIRSGKIPIDRIIDLHGHTMPEAYQRLVEALHMAHQLGERMMLVITGKGRNGQGVLRQKLPLWINEPELRGLILAIETARTQDGGEGAFYVLLKRTKRTNEYKWESADDE